MSEGWGTRCVGKRTGLNAEKVRHSPRVSASLGVYLSDDFVLLVGWAGNAYLVGGAVKDVTDYYSENAGGCK